MFLHLSVPHFVEYVIDELDNNFNILDSNERYPKDVVTISDIINYINLYDINRINDENHFKVYNELYKIVDSIRNKINKLTKTNIITTVNIIERVRKLGQDDLFNVSDFCYNFLYEIIEDYNDVDTEDWNITNNMSPNLLSLFDKTNGSVDFNAEVENWLKPAYHGLDNSMPIISARTAIIRSTTVAEDDDEDDDDDDDSFFSYDIDDDEEYNEYKDDSRINNIAMSESLMLALGLDVSTKPKVETNWKAPSVSGLEHSARKCGCYSHTVITHGSILTYCLTDSSYSHYQEQSQLQRTLSLSSTIC